MGLTLVKGNIIEDGAVTSGTLGPTSITSDTLDNNNPIANVKMAVDPSDASTFNAGDVPLAQLDNIPVPNTTILQDDIALLAFKTQANGSLARYDLVDQSVDAFEDASGIDAGASTNETRNSAGKYYSGLSDTQTAFTSTGNTTWTSPAGVTSIKVLVVGGGGSASKGGWTPGGVGAGGLVYVDGYTVVASQLYNLTIGAGGAGGGSPANPGYVIGGNGGNSVFDVSDTSETLTAVGGGYGGWYNGTHTVGTGGSGGGGSVASLVGATNQPVSFGSYSNVGFGFAGGAGNSGGTNRPSGGGGGAGSVGQAQQGSGQSGNGGAGKDYSAVFGTDVGHDGWFAGGSGGAGTGGAAPGIANGGSGGKGGGGTSGRTYGTPGATAGMANTGGAGGAETNDMNQPDGGSGVIIVQYPVNVNMTLVSTATTAQAVPTKGDMVLTYTDGTGTAVINTNIKGYVSRDGGTTYTQGTLALEGTTGGHNILTFHNLDISGQPSGSSMRYKIETLVQGASMATRIQAVSLGWS